RALQRARDGGQPGLRTAHHSDSRPDARGRKSPRGEGAGTARRSARLTRKEPARLPMAGAPRGTPGRVGRGNRFSQPAGAAAQGRPKLMMKIAELDERIAQHARALIAGDERAGESMVVPAGLASWRSVAAAISGRQLDRYELLACARIGMQFMAKTRFFGAGGVLTLLVRWKQTDGQ